MELFKASQQWKDRPADERFPSLQALYGATKSYADQAREVVRPWSDLRVQVDSGEVRLVGKANEPATLTNWSFGQLAARVKAPADYLRRLPATLAAQNLNHGLAARPEGDAQMLFHTNEGLLVRALTSDRYSRIWNYEVGERLLALEANGWQPARPDIRAELGDWPALYASDHDMFAFVMHPQVVVSEPGADGLRKGVIVENSEVGDAMLRLTRFLYREMCGNHIIWGAKDVAEFSLRHVGRIRERLSEWEAHLTHLSNESTSDIEATIASAKRVTIAATKEEVLDKLFGLRSLGLSRKALTAGYEDQETRVATGVEKDDPRTVWGMVQGITHYATSIKHADTRMEIDKGAGRLLAVNF